eukprot:Nitzschia sp. Nitz4//scaffold26_size159584//75799//77895//NITZ4_002493-RA/size159584-processed-gene-0.75-mRNA-1//-1//CDS//3329545088//9063//frame0
MITYNRSAFGLNLLFRLHGSAVYRGVIPGIVAVAISVWLRLGAPALQESAQRELGHPYVVGVVVSGTTFLIVFRASQGYSRYWEAASCCYQMMSKWMDATSHTAVYHMQCEHYNPMKPPSFFDFPDLDSKCLTRDRERIRRKSQDPLHRHNISHRRSVSRSINRVDTGTGFAFVRSKKKAKKPHPPPIDESSPSPMPFSSSWSLDSQSLGGSQFHNHHPSETLDTYCSPRFLTGKARLDGNWSQRYPSPDPDNASFIPLATFYDPMTKSIGRDQRGFASTIGGRTPALFLQELAHLTSLMTAVALATLRNDIDGAESPLDFYHPGQPWPKVDPSDVPEMYDSLWHRHWATLMFFMGRGRTPHERTRYNATRPLPVLGGVSEAEIQFLQMARGPYAKTQLCWNWLSEFITREHLAGSLGNVGPPIISRIIQFLGDGMIYYNHGRKIMSIPFPFVHAQLSAFFVIVMMGLLPFLMDQYCDDLWCGIMLTFLSTVCLSGIHEVARELENPFRNVPNELPLVTMMAEFNEALLVMYAGYHPDFFWEPPKAKKENGREQPVEGTTTATKDFIGSERKGNKAPPKRDEGYLQDIPPPPSGCTSVSLDESESEETVISTNDAEKFGAMTENQQTPSETNAADETFLEGSDTNGNGHGGHDGGDNANQEMDQLRDIIRRQGEIMNHLLTEQSKLNLQMATLLSHKS